MRPRAQPDVMRVSKLVVIPVILPLVLSLQSRRASAGGSCEDECEIQSGETCDGDRAYSACMAECDRLRFPYGKPSLFPDGGGD